MKGAMDYLISYKKTSWIKEIFDNTDFDKLGIARNNNLTPDLREPCDKLIRFGTYASYLPEANIEYNKREAIKNATDKLKARKILEDNEIPIPLTFDREGLKKVQYVNFPVIGRKRGHSGGREMNLINNYKELVEEVKNPQSDYYSSFYDKSTEYRIHVASGKILIAYKKVVEDSDKIAWNLNDRGGADDVYTYRWSEYWDIIDVLRTANRAVNALGLDYGTVDILADPMSGGTDLPKYVVSEVNTAPKLKGYGVKRFSQYFNWLLRKDEKVDYMHPEDLDRLFFTNDELNFN